MSFPLTVTDVKQYVYCPRIIFFTYVMPIGSLPTHNMLIGQSRHVIVEMLERRRTLKRYQLQKANKWFKVRCYSESVNLHGVVDMVLEDEKRAFPVEFKNTSRAPQVHHLCQLAAYAILVEEQFTTSVDRGFIYSIPNNRVNSVLLDNDVKGKVHRICNEIRKMVMNETMPKPTRDKRKCYDCEWRRFCADL